MVQETVTTETPPSLPELLTPTEPVTTEPVVEAPTETEEPAATEGTEETEGAEAKPSWETDRERYVEDESFKAEFVSAKEADRQKREAQREGHIAGQKQESGQRKQIMESLSVVQQGFAETAGILRKAVADGYLDGEFVVRALQAHAPAWAALQGYNEKVAQAITNDGQRNGGMIAIAQIANHPLINDAKLGQQFVDKFFYDYGTDPKLAGETLLEFVGEVFDRVTERAKKPVAKLEAAIEKGKLEARKSGPDTAAKGGGGGLTYKQLMDMPVEEYEKVPEATKRQLFAEGEARRKAG